MARARIRFADESYLQLTNVPNRNEMLINGGVLLDAEWGVQRPACDTDKMAHKVEDSIAGPNRSAWLTSRDVTRVEFDA